MAKRRTKSVPGSALATQLGRRGFTRRMAQVVGGTALAALGLGAQVRRTAAAPQAAPIAHTYCVPGELVVTLRHPAGLAPAQLAAQLHAAPLLAEPLLAGAAIDPARIVGFGDSAGAWSLAVLAAPLATDAASLVAACAALSQRAAAGSGQLRVEQVTPHWMGGGAGDNNGSGGPSGHPAALAPAALQTLRSTDPSFWQLALPPGLALPPETERGAGVDVFILDSIPDRAGLAQAYARWHASHPLIAALLGPASPLELIYAGEGHLLHQIDYILPNANYRMADHGLFVAGIIHSIAPAARLHLVEVLNPYGVGSLESIARGFARAAEAASSSQVVVNASLCLDVPQPDPAWLQRLHATEPFWARQPAAQLAQTIQPFRQICDHLHSRQAAVVAAAGNEGSAGYHPPARYPAAFASVLGVGALKADAMSPTEYSNLADMPLQAGIAAFGGETMGGTADLARGMLGLYTGEFPDGTPNQTGWARWAGTSFATPVVAGTLAALMSAGHTREAALQLLRAAGPGQGNLSEVGTIFPARQRCVA